MASSDTERAMNLRDRSDLYVAFVAGLCTVGLSLALKFGAGVEVSFVYRLSPLAPYFVYVFTRGTGFSTRGWMALVVAVTLGTFGLFAF